MSEIEPYKDDAEAHADMIAGLNAVIDGQSAEIECFTAALRSIERIGGYAGGIASAALVAHTRRTSEQLNTSGEDK